MFHYSYYLALEEFVKVSINPKAIKTAKENGNYDKLITRKMLEFTKRNSPKATWGVTRPNLINDMRDMIEFFSDIRGIGIRGKAYCYINYSGKLRIMFADSKADLLRKQEMLTDSAWDVVAYHKDSIKEIASFEADGITTKSGEFIEFTSHVIDTFVNIFEKEVTVNE